MRCAVRRSSTPLRGVLLLFLLLTSVACACAGEEESARQAWLRNTLVEDNRALLEREPALARGKLQKMASSPYSYFRGTLPQFLRDSATPGPGHLPTRYSDPRGAGIWLVGDPHLENLGSIGEGPAELALEFNDFDSARHGPWILDLRRLALSFYVAAHAPLGHEQALDIADQVAQGYTQQLTALRQGAAARPIQRGASPIVDDLLRRARRDGAARQELERYTRLSGDQRQIFLGVVAPPQEPGVLEDELWALSEPEEALVRQALAQWTFAQPEAAAPPEARRLKGAARRVGAGVSSYPVLRYYALLEGPGEGPEDDLLIELKEIPDAPWLPGLRLFPPRPWTSNSQRVAQAQDALQSRPGMDPWLGWAQVGPVALKLRRVTRYQRGLSVERVAQKLEEGDWSAPDLAELARLAGELLARTHATGPSLEGEPGLALLPQSLTQEPALLHQESRAFVQSYGPQVLEDHQSLVELLRRHGPALGYRASAQDRHNPNAEAP